LGDGLEADVIVVLLAGVEVLFAAHDEGEPPLEGGPVVRLLLVEHGEAGAERLLGEDKVLARPEVLEGQCESAVGPACGWLGIGHGDAHVADGFLRLGLIVIEIRDALLGVGFAEGEGRGTKEGQADKKCSFHTKISWLLMVFGGKCREKRTKKCFLCKKMMKKVKKCLVV